MDYLRKNIEKLLNSACQENESNTPDFVLAEYLIGCLNVFNTAVIKRDNWYGRVFFDMKDSFTDPAHNPEQSQHTERTASPAPESACPETSYKHERPETKEWFAFL